MAAANGWPHGARPVRIRIAKKNGHFFNEVLFFVVYLYCVIEQKGVTMSSIVKYSLIFALQVGFASVALADEGDAGAAGAAFLGMGILGFIFLWVIISIIPSVIAHRKGRSWFGFLLLSLFFSPLIGLIVVLIMSPLNSQSKAISSKSSTKKESERYEGIDDSERYNESA